QNVENQGWPERRPRLPYRAAVTISTTRSKKRPSCELNSCEKKRRRWFVATQTASLSLGGKRMSLVSSEPSARLERFREYLHLLARMQIDPRLRRDCDASDIVQTVLLRAHQGEADFRGTTHEELAAWLRKILANTLADVLRDRLRDRRDIRREVNLEKALNESSLHLAACAAARER